MNVILIFIISAVLLSIPNEIPNASKKISFTKKEIENWEVNQRSVLIATQTGNKKSVPKPLIEVYKQFGLLHLMTPSGIHLSSIFLFFFIFIKGKFRLLIYLPLLLISFFTLGFYSLKRIIYFHLFKIFIKNNQLSFILTFILDIMIGGYTLSPMSFTFSFLCWGVIIFSKTKISIFLNLFACQMLISLFLDQSINFMGLILNPIFTGLFSSVFPLLSINFWLLNLNWLYDIINLFIKIFNESLVFCSYTFEFMSFTASISVIVLFMFYNLKHPQKKVVALLIFLHLGPMKVESSSEASMSFLATHESKHKLLKVTKSKYHYFNRVCTRVFKESFWDINCKKKALRYGGPELY
jgi:competence protein ComEC